MSSALINPFGEAGSPPLEPTAMERREEAEIMAMVARAKRFPARPAGGLRQDPPGSSASRRWPTRGLLYSRGGQDISDLTIRAAEAIASAWGNIRSGWREVSRAPTGDDGVPYSLVEARAWDLKYLPPSRDHLHSCATGATRSVAAAQAHRRARHPTSCAPTWPSAGCAPASCPLIPGDGKEPRANRPNHAGHAPKSPRGPEQMLGTSPLEGSPGEHIEKKIQRNPWSPWRPRSSCRCAKSTAASGRHGQARETRFWEGRGSAWRADGPTQPGRHQGQRLKPGGHACTDPEPSPATEGAPAQADGGGPVAPRPETLVDKMKKARSVDSPGCWPALDRRTRNYP